MARRRSAGAMLAVVCGLVLLAGSAAHAHVGTKLFPIYEVPPWAAIDVRDGSLDDWAEIAPGPSMTMADFDMYSWPSAGFNPASIDIRVYLAWSAAEQRIYVGVERFDDIYFDFSGGDVISMWDYDGIEFAIDGDHSGGQYMYGQSRRERDSLSVEKIHLLTDRQAQRYAAVAESPDGRHLSAAAENLGFDDWISSPPHGDAGGRTQDVSAQSPSPLPGRPWHRSVIELYVTPWDSLDWRSPERSTPSQLQADRIIGFSVFVPDHDDRPGDWQFYYWPVGSWQQFLWYAEAFVDGRLLPCASCADQATSMASQSWARIKAGFR